jgi:hypothetical protein
MDKIIPRRRGRPPGSRAVPWDVLEGVWVQVLITRIKARTHTGKTPSVRKACQEIADNGGIISVIGGNQDALVAANAARKKSWQRFQFRSDGSGVSPDATGNIFVSHTISDAGTLQARYSEANRIAKSDRRVRLAWMNLARQMVGLTPKRPVRPSIGRPPHGRV